MPTLIIQCELPKQLFDYLLNQNYGKITPNGNIVVNTLVDTDEADDAVTNLFFKSVSDSSKKSDLLNRVDNHKTA